MNLDSIETHRSTCLLKNGQMSYLKIPAGHTAFVILHGRMESGSCWERFARMLGGGYSFYLPDARGHGYSTIGGKDIILENLIDDVDEFLDGIGIDNFIVMGHSMGAALAAEYAGRKKKNIRGMILCDPPWRYKTHYIDGNQEMVTRMSRALRTFKKVSEKSLVGFVQFHNPRWHHSECVRVAEALKRTDVDMASSFSVPIFFDAWNSSLAAADYPILLLSGNPHKGALLQPKTISHITENYKTVSHAHFERAGHNICFDCFDEAVAAVSSFLSEHEL